MTTLSKKELQLIDGGKDIRDKYISKTEVLDRVRELSLLPYEESATTEMVAEYYNVNTEVIKKVTQRNYSEFIEDGYNVLTGTQLRDVKSLCQIKSRARSIAIFPRRAILRVGMLLRDSEVAKEVRAYLLNVEETAIPTQKEYSSKSWLSKEDEIIKRCVIESINNDGTLTKGLQDASMILDLKLTLVQGRWQSKIKKNVDKVILDKIKSNRGRHLREARKVYINGIDETNNNINLELGYQIDKVYRENSKLEKENALLKEENENLKRLYKKVKNEHSTVMNIIGSAMKHHTSQVLKMDRNKGL